MTDESPILSIIIPVFNEEAILHTAIDGLLEGLWDLGRPHEIILAENGSTDRTVAVAEQVVQKHPTVRLISLPEPNYGAALKRGILEARGQYVICDEIDLCDVDFYRRALALLDHDAADLVVGSKVMAGAQDQRPVLRHAATLVVSGMLRVLVGFRGTDTHGLKAMNRARLRGTVERCIVDKDLFASELVIRAQREGLRTTEIPVEIMEKRTPSINLLRRVPNVLKNLARLTYIFRVKG
ncbi:MAG TPA: glycosyltransferase family 2 protein [Polyangia bacterium]|jgi:glycosyltransferase involved in cell wall biosynthesis